MEVTDSCQSTENRNLLSGPSLYQHFRTSGERRRVARPESKGVDQINHAHRGALSVPHVRFATQGNIGNMFCGLARGGTDNSLVWAASPQEASVCGHILWLWLHSQRIP
jgi:hypothetical protein